MVQIVGYWSVIDESEVKVGWMKRKKSEMF
jgi:hypothetical protein